MSFFDSDMVRSDIAQISELQEDIYTNIFKFNDMNKEEKLFHVNMLERLIEKQKILYARLSLSDDSEARMMKEQIVESAVAMGLSRDVDMNVLFKNMLKMTGKMRETIDKMDSDL
jgi:hypothetical protein